MKLPILAVVIALALGACGTSADPTPVQEIDRAAWKAELLQLDDAGPNPDLKALERLTRSDCAEDVDEMALGFTLEGARPDVTRINMRYVCPDQVGKVDDALEQIQDSSQAVDEACALPESQRTEEQSQLAEALSC